MSHTMMVILAGIVMLSIMMLSAKGNYTGAVKRFVPLWLLLSVLNMLVGVFYAGYSFREELPILLVVFIVPVAAAYLAKALMERHV